jgi:hypothetical protein
VDLQAGFTGVRGQLDVIEQHAKGSVLNGDEDGLAGVGPADTEALSGDGDASVLVDASHRTQWGLPVVAVASLRVVFREVWRGGSDLAALARS